MEDNKNIRVLVMEPDKVAEERTVPNTLEALQELVGGHIEVINLRKDLALIVNEEGFLKHMHVCMVLAHRNRLSALAGPVVAIGTDGEEFCGLSDTNTEAVRIMYEISTGRRGHGR